MGWDLEKYKYKASHIQLLYVQFSKNCNGIVSLHDSEHFSQVSHRPVGMPAGDDLQHGLQGALVVPHRVGVSDPGGGEGAEGGQVFGVLHSVDLWIQQNHQLLQDVQFIQHCLQRSRHGLRTCGRELDVFVMMTLEQQKKRFSVIQVTLMSRVIWAA